MSDPTTPTGKMLWDEVKEVRGASPANLIAIEEEAAAAERERLVREMRDALAAMPDPDPSPSRNSLSWRAARAAVEGIIKLVEAPSDD